MSDFALRRESIEEVIDYNVLIDEFENRKEYRRLVTTGMLVGFKLKAPNMTYTDFQSYRNFFIGKYGALTSFTFTSPFDNVEYTVRFRPGSFKSTFDNGYFQSSFEFQRIF